MGRRRLRTVSAGELAHYRAHFLEAVREDGMVCLECGSILRALPHHVWMHGMTIDEYKAKWGYKRTNPLTVPALVENMRQRALAINLAGYAPPDALEKGREALLRLKPQHRLEARLAKGAVTRSRHASGWRPHEKLQKVDATTLRALVGEGLTILQIAARLGMAYTSVKKRIHRLGLTSPAIAPRVRRASDAELLTLRREGLLLREIAARTGMRAAAVGKRLRRLRRRGLLPGPAAAPAQGSRDAG